MQYPKWDPETEKEHWGGGGGTTSEMRIKSRVYS